jgi:hypothetical protein
MKRVRQKCKPRNCGIRHRYSKLLGHEDRASYVYYFGLPFLIKQSWLVVLTIYQMRNLEIVIYLYSTSVCFGVSNRLYSLSSEKQKVRFGLQVFMQLVFGFHSVTWAVKQAGQYVPGELVLIHDVLSHYKHNRIVGSDYFLEAARKFSENHRFLQFSCWFTLYFVARLLRIN